MRYLIYAAMVFASGCTPTGFVRARPYADGAAILDPYTRSGIESADSISVIERESLHMLREQLRDGLEESAAREGER